MLSIPAISLNTALKSRSTPASISDVEITVVLIPFFISSFIFAIISERCKGVIYVDKWYLLPLQISYNSLAVFLLFTIISALSYSCAFSASEASSHFPIYSYLHLSNTLNNDVSLTAFSILTPDIYLSINLS